MIHIYRMTRYADQDKISFQATSDTVQRFKRLFPIGLKPSKTGVEKGHYFYLKEDYREKLFSPLKSFFQEHYSPPEIRLSCFRARSPLSSAWPKDVWKQKVNEAVQTVFLKDGYSVQDNPYGGMVEVIPPKPSLQIENVEVYWTVGYRVEVGDDLQPVLWCSDHFRFLLDGRPAGQDRIERALGDKSAVLQIIRQFTTRNADEEFNLLCRFIKRIPPLNACEGIQFSDRPLTARDAGLETWFWLHDFDACFEVSNGLKTNLAQALLGEGSGLYTQPDDLLLIVLIPDPKSSPLVPHVNWSLVFSDIQKFMRQAMPDVENPMYHFSYPLAGDLSHCVKSIQEAVEKYPNRRVLGLMATPSRASRRSASQDVLAVERQSNQMYKNLRDISRGGYVKTVDWNRLKTSIDRQYVLHNALLGSLYALNTNPWKIVNLPFAKEPTSGNYFLGLYSSTDEHPALAGTLFGYEGDLVAFGGVYLDEQGAGTYEEELDSLINSLISKGIHSSKPRPAHLIIHASSELQGYSPEIEASARSLSLSIDLVTIKQSSMRFWQSGNIQGTPSHGIAVGSEASKTVYMMNTKSVGEMKNSEEKIFPNPHTIAIHRAAGSSPLKVLAAQVFWLSNGHINALHRTVDTPVTISYARSLHDHIRKTRRAMHVTRNYRKILIWF